MTAASNRFQGRSSADPTAQNDAAQAEFDRLAAALGDAGVNVIVADDSFEPHTPDSVFPNNWVSFHADGRVVLYPMEAENRRLERRPDLIQALSTKHGFLTKELVDLAYHEQAGHYLEGTGSMVLDRRDRVAYACLSSRTHLDPLGDFAQRMDYEVVTFDAVDRDGVAIYHTNVLMSVGEKIAVICAAAIEDEEQRTAVLKRLADSGREIILLSYSQLQAFAGNMLELRGSNGNSVMAMSQQAYDVLDDSQIELIRGSGDIVSVDISTIEASAGGSVRCMLAEIHLPTA